MTELQDALDLHDSRVANGEQTYRCSQHGFRATPRCNDNPACSLQLGAWVGITENTE